MEPNQSGAETISYRNAFDHAVIGMGLLGLDGLWQQVNPSLCGILGFTRLELMSRPFAELFSTPEVTADHDQMEQMLHGEILSYQTERVHAHAGAPCWMLLSMSLVRDEDGRPRHFMVQVEDITARKKYEIELQEAQARLQAQVLELEKRNEEMKLIGEMGETIQACRSLPEAYKSIGKAIRNLFPGYAGALGVLDDARQDVEIILHWGEVLTTERFFGPDECLGLRRNRLHLMTDPALDVVCPHIPQPPPGGALCLPLSAQREVLGVLHLGRLQPGPMPANELQLAHTAAEQISLGLVNLRLQESLRSQSVRDPLTGLFNRRYLEESLEREIGRAKRNQKSFCVVMMDVDHFKDFNDAHGHDAGDQALKETAALMEAQLRRTDVACRYGGEEFILILPEASLHDARQKAEALRQACHDLQISLGTGDTTHITLSLGVAAFPLHGSSGEALLQAADNALYQAKRKGRDQVVCATPHKGLHPTPKE